MARVHAIVNQKGGVGKTHLSVNLAAVMAEVMGATTAEVSPVTVVSTDRQASAIWWSERVGAALPFDFVQAVDPDPKVKQSPAVLRSVLAKLKKDPRRRDMIVDTPGTLDDTATLEAVLAVADDVIVPMPCEGMAFQPTVRTVTGLLAPRGITYGIVLNNWDPRDGTTPRDKAAAFIDALGYPRANTVIRRYAVHRDAAEHGRVCTQYGNDKISLQAKMDFLTLALELGMTRARPHLERLAQAEVS